MHVYIFCAGRYRSMRTDVFLGCPAMLVFLNTRTRHILSFTCCTYVIYIIKGNSILCIKQLVLTYVIFFGLSSYLATWNVLKYLQLGTYLGYPRYPGILSIQGSGYIPCNLGRTWDIPGILGYLPRVSMLYTCSIKVLGDTSTCGFTQDMCAAPQ